MIEKHLREYFSMNFADDLDCRLSSDDIESNILLRRKIQYVIQSEF